MAPLPVISNAFRVSINYLLAGEQVATNVINIFSLTQTQDQVGAIVVATMNANMFAPTSSSIVIDSIDVLPYDGVSPTKNFPVVGLTGGATGPGVPAVSLVASFRTPFRGRSRRGRAFLPWVAEGVQDEGIVEVATADDALAGWTQFQVDLLPALISQAVVSIKLAQIFVIESTIVNRKLDTIRLRQNAVQE